MAAAIAITGIPFPASQVQASESAITVSGLTGNALSVTDDTNETISIGNDQLSRTFKIVNGKLTTGTIYNKLAGENVVFTPAAGSEEFVIRTLGSEGARVEPETPLTSVRPVIESDEEETPTVPVISVSSNMANDGGGMAAATDKNAGTYWSSDMETANAAYFQVIFAGEKKVTKVDYTPRYDGSAIYNCTGRITGMKFQIYDGTNWTDLTDAQGAVKTFDLGTDNTVAGYPIPVTVDLSDLNVVAHGIRVMASASYHWQEANKNNTWAADSTVKTVMFEQPVQAKYVKLLAKEGVGGFASAAEINLFGERAYPSDTEQPSAPVLSVNEVSSKTVELSWTESSDGENGSGVSEYYLKQDGEEIARFAANAREYIVGGLQPETEYSFEVVAVDRAGNEAGSEIIKVTTGFKAEVLGYTLSLEGTIGVNFHMQLGDAVLADEDAYMNFTLGGKEYMKIPVKNATIDEETALYVFKCGVPVKDMETEIEAQIILSDGQKGPEYTYTVEEYTDKITSGEVEGITTETIELVEAMSDFGNFATAYFADGSLEETAEMKAVTAEILEDYQVELPTDSIYYGSSLLLKSDTIIRHYFTEKVTEDAVKKGDLYYIESEGIPAHKLGTEIVTKVGDMEITYSPLSYAYIALSRDDVDENLKSVMRAMYLYYEAAQAYKDAITN